VRGKGSNGHPSFLSFVAGREKRVRGKRRKGMGEVFAPFSLMGKRKKRRRSQKKKERDRALPLFADK